MLRKVLSLAGIVIIVIASFMLALSVIDNGFAATYLSIFRYINP